MRGPRPTQDDTGRFVAQQEPWRAPQSDQEIADNEDMHNTVEA